jgi:hypothetical protein
MKKVLFFLLVAVTAQLVNAQNNNVGIGTTSPNASAMLEINSSNKGLLLPRVADTSSIASPAKGLVIYSNNNNKLWFYNGSRWQQSISNSGGMDSIWYKTQDSIVYTAKPYVGINTDYSLIAPQANLQVNGSLLVQGKLDYSSTAPTAGQTYTMNNTGVTQNIATTDSVFRVYDPGGTGNYNNNMQGNIFLGNNISPQVGYKVHSVAADFGIAVGDTLWISSYPFPNCRNNYAYQFTNTTINPADFIIGKSIYYLIFRSNADGINNKGFNFILTRLFNSEPNKQIQTAGPSLYFNTSNASFSAGSNARAKGAGSLALMNGNATGSGSIAIGNAAEASGQLATSIGAGYYYTNYATGDYSTAIGIENNANTLYSVALGVANDVIGDRSTAIGQANHANALYSTAIGVSNDANGDKSTALGYNNIAESYGSTVVGIYNDNSIASNPNVWVINEPVFIVGNGSDNSNRSNALVIRKNGNVGIGTNAPTHPLNFDNALGDKIALYGNTANTYGFGIQSSLLQIHADQSSSDIAFGYGSSGSFTENMRIKGSGNVGIGTSAPGADLHIKHAGGGGLILENASDNNKWRIYSASGDNNLTFYNNANTEVADIDDVTGAYTAISDSRLKKNIKSMQPVLPLLMQLNPTYYQFNWQQPNEQRQIGLLAQEAYQLFPELVSYSKEKDLYKMNYAGFSTVTIKAIQEQQLVIQTLQQQIDELKALVNQLLKNK